MDYKKKFSKKALNDFKLIDLAITKNDQNAYSEIMKSYKNSIYFTILKMTKNGSKFSQIVLVRMGGDQVRFHDPLGQSVREPD